MSSETAKYRLLTAPHCYRADGYPGAGLDIASQGDPVVPWAWQLDLPTREFKRYSNGREPEGIQLEGYGHHALPIASKSLDFIYSSHFLEDVPRGDWPRVLREWSRCLKVGGKLIVLVPERTRWQAALRRGQPPNCSHHGPEPLVGDITKAASCVPNLKVLSEALTNLSSEDYTILAVIERT